MKINKDCLKYPQIDAAFRYIYDNPNKYHFRNRKLYPITDIYEFGIYNGNSLCKISSYLKNNPDLIGIKPRIFAYDSFEGLPKEDGVFEKFKEGNYKSENSPEDIRVLVNYDNLSVYKTWFSDLKKSMVNKSGKPAILIHIDCDLYTSTVDALTFMINNNLVSTNTLIAYDEFRVGKYKGEHTAHEEVLSKMQIRSYEIWHNIYYDKNTGDEVRQSVFEVT